jgi:cyclase
MLNHRVIPCLLLSDGGLVKTRKFKNATYIGDPINAVRIFNEKEVDELVLLDMHASLEKRGPNLEFLKQIASECFMPLAYGGGISSIEQIQALFRIGIEKVILNTALYRDPTFVRNAVATFGSQAITASIDVRRRLLGRRDATILAGTVSTGLSPVVAARSAEALGVGEILLTSIDREGSMRGYDIPLLAEVSQSVSIPVIASGGAGKLEDFRTAVLEGYASAVSAGSMFVFNGPHRAVLITYPDYKILQGVFRS